MRLENERDIAFRKVLKRIRFVKIALKPNIINHMFITRRQSSFLLRVPLQLATALCLLF